MQGEKGLQGVSTLSTSEQEALKELLPYVKFVKEGIDKKPTIQFTGANVQVYAGGSTENQTNGLGNLYVGLDGLPGNQTGSNNLIVGVGEEYTSFGSIIGGEFNQGTGQYSAVFGTESKTSGQESFANGTKNTASGAESSVTSGVLNVASAFRSSVAAVPSARPAPKARR